MSFLLSEAAPLAPAASAESFQTRLENCAQAIPDPDTPLPSISNAPQVRKARWEEVVSDFLKRAWSTLQNKYKVTTTKRLRLAETISLGEKRFVAIVSVEGREFLIGGGISGMSLLAQLGSEGAVVRNLGQTLGDGGGVL
jgi:hypothetical protein